MNAVNPVPILVDDREQAGGLPEALRRRLGGRVHVQRLDVGDVIIGERAVVERKEAADFVASLLDGRLERQAHALGTSGLMAVIIIEGEFNRETLAGMPAEEVRAAILSLQLDRRLAVVRSRNLEDTALWIEALARREREGARPFTPTLRPTGAQQPHPAMHRKISYPPTRPASDPFLTAPLQTAPMAVLLRIEGIGRKRAQALLEHFGTLPQMLAAGEAGIAAVDGIGPAGARKIHEALKRLFQDT